MTLLTIQDYSETYTSAYNSGWIIGLIIHIIFALGILRLITWGLKALMSHTLMKGDKRRAAVAAFGIAVGLAILYVVVTRMNLPKFDYEYIPGRGMMRIEYQYLGIVPVSAIYVGMLILWLIVDLKLADRDQPPELSIFSEEKKESDQSQQGWPGGVPNPYPVYPQYASPPPQYPGYPPINPYAPPNAHPRPNSYPPPNPYARPNTYPPANAYPAAPAMYQPPMPPPPTPTPTPEPRWQTSTEVMSQGANQLAETTASVPDLIKQLATLRDSGVLSHDEFESKKTELLKRL